jgi:Zn-dependent protease with chaperone function
MHGLSFFDLLFYFHDRKFIAMTTVFFYPSNPLNVPSSVTETSASFKKEVSKVAGSIFLFFLVYFVMFILAIGLVIACVYGGYMLIINMPRLVTILVGIGIIGLGVMVFIFLIKFIFAVSRFDRSGSIEITKTDQPELFEFIRKLTKDTHTSFPKKIYLSADVNACVFYDSSFWSMFFPVRKNLQIGLGLVNCLNISEFKAVMAHEFGHFSQRSMKLGSFVYNVNRIIYNMLYENKDYVNSLKSFASASSYFAFFANITFEIVRGIQSILRSMYSVINKNYLGLSREMEFHADAVAASVSGGNNLISALKRIELGNTCYNISLQKCDEFFKEKVISKNVYQNQWIVLSQVAKEFNMPLKEGLPLVNREYIEGQNFSRVNFKDQWASHPTTREREVHLEQLAIHAEPEAHLAWVVFQNSEKLQEKLTKKLYEKLNTQDTSVIDGNEFESRYKKDFTEFSLPKEYKNFYNGRRIAILSKEEFENFKNDNYSFDELFSGENVSLPGKIIATEKDIKILRAIKEKKTGIKSFDFDGEKYEIEKATAIISALEKELEDQKRSLNELDKKTVSFFYNKALKKSFENSEKLKTSYLEYFEDCKKADEFLHFLNLMIADLGSIYRGETIAISTIESIINDLKTNREDRFKADLKQWLAMGVFNNKQSLKQGIEVFIDSDYKYFDGAAFKEKELRSLNDLVNTSWQAIGSWLFFKFKNILQIQLPCQ